MGQFERLTYTVHKDIPKIKGRVMCTYIGLDGKSYCVLSGWGETFIAEETKLVKIERLF